MEPAVSAENVILQGRAFTEKLMLSEGIIRRATGATTIDPVTYEEVPVYETVYEGIGKLKLPDSLASNASAVPGTTVAALEAYLSLPVNAESGAVRVGDIWETTANPMDPALVGQRARITRPHSQTFATARRFPIEAFV